MTLVDATTIDSPALSRYPQSMIDLQETDLIERSRNGDEAAFELLVKQHSSLVFNLAWRLLGQKEEAEDLAQEAFLRLHKSLPSFRGESRLSTWLYRTTTRLAIDQLRREKIKRRLFFFRRDNDAPDPVELADDPTTNPRRLLRSREAMAQLNRALQTLSPQQRVVFMLRHYEGLALKEIGEHLNLKVGTVKAHLHRAIQHLRRELAEHHEVTP
ncbi:MAG: sigma-70 family RNA polymerase sigma factor [Desulfuromonadales bacterium]|nr:sigma-70 family RNA polymerase sigma factor [Desulfuromonadales bacterium]